MIARFAVLALLLTACSGASSSTSTPAAKSSETSACSGYRPICISGDSVCSVDASGCSICTCQSRIGSEFAPNAFVPGTSSPAPLMGQGGR